MFSKAPVLLYTSDEKVLVSYLASIDNELLFDWMSWKSMSWQDWRSALCIRYSNRRLLHRNNHTMLLNIANSTKRSVILLFQDPSIDQFYKYQADPIDPLQPWINSFYPAVFIYTHPTIFTNNSNSISWPTVFTSHFSHQSSLQSRCLSSPILGLYLSADHSSLHPTVFLWPHPGLVPSANNKHQIVCHAIDRRDSYCLFAAVWVCVQVPVSDNQWIPQD